MQEIPVCKKAFQSLHGITGRRLETIQNCFKEKGTPPKDQRGRHLNRPQRLTEEKKRSVFDHINSFKGLKSKESLRCE